MPPASSAPLGNLCALAVKKSSIPIRGLPRHSTTAPGISFDFGKNPAVTEIAVGVPPFLSGTQSGLAGRQIVVKNGKTTTYKITSTGKLIDDALEAVEKENARNGDLRIASLLRRANRSSPLPNLAGLIDFIATIPFQHADPRLN